MYMWRHNKKQQYLIKNYDHQQCDLFPEFYSANILLDRHLDAKIGDLGLAQQATGGTVTGELTHITKKNTDAKDYKNKAYYAPEILRGNGFSVKGDTYAFGVVSFF